MTEFKDWLREVDRILVSKVGLGVDDLTDAPYRDHFDGGTEPENMAAIVLVEWNDLPENLLNEMGLSL